METWVEVGKILASAAATLGAAVLLAYTAAKQWRAQLKLQQRTKLIERAHAAISDVTSQAFAALHTHQDWREKKFDQRRLPPEQRDPTSGHDESRQAYRLRWQLSRQAGDLPPALHAAFDRLRASYEELDNQSAAVMWAANLTADDVLVHLAKFTDELRIWELAARKWITGSWHESEL